MKKISLVLFILSIQFGYAQLDFDNAYDKILYSLNEENRFKNSDDQIIDLTYVVGSPFLQTNFVSGSVLNTITGELLGYQMRYNIFNDRIEVRNSEDRKIYSVQRVDNFTCKIAEDIFILLSYIDDDGHESQAYFQKLSEGKASLLKRYTCKYYAKTIGRPPNFNATPAKFVVKQSYYLLNNGKLTTISSNKKKFFQSFGKFENQIKNYAKTHNLKHNKERDITRIISYYNTLI